MSAFDPRDFATSERVQLCARHSEDAAIQAQPQIAEPVVEDADDVRVRQPILAAEMLEVIIPPTTQTTPAADPKRTVRVCQQAVDGIVQQTLCAREDFESAFPPSG